ncbi:5'-nucleotidase-like protein [Balneicella halophila]|uniref:5'-nucleotidase-like protein n=2 Tax=Balneicella halophila TaxID=1537566 RepID=A0A7L4UPA2_BALHA|nr:5'-nucleotidase-like protein [Balneicella halophila]
MLNNMLKKLLSLPFIFVVLLSVACNTTQVDNKTIDYQNYPITEEIQVDSLSDFVNTINTYRKELIDEMSVVVGYSSMYMPIERPESLLSNMVADFTWKLGKEYCKENHLPYTVDASIINIGGLRKPLPEGEIILSDIYEISPFENKLYIVAMYGKDLRKLFDHITRSGGEGVGNIRLIADKETHKLKEAYINNEPLNDEKIYHIISIDYLISGGDGMVSFSKKIDEIDMNLKSRDALLEYVKQEHAANRPLTSRLDKRISYE